MKKCLSFLQLSLLSTREVEFLPLLLATSDFEVEFNCEGTLRLAYSYRRIVPISWRICQKGQEHVVADHQVGITKTLCFLSYL